MMWVVQLSIVCAAAALVGNSLHEPIDLSFHLAPGTVLSKSFDMESRGRIDSIWMGNSNLTAAWPNRDIAVEASLRVTDEYLRVGRGRPLELIREFDEMSTVWELSDRSDVLHPLLYRSLRFTWDEREQSYQTEWESRRSLPDAPRTVWEDLDYRTLLPDEPVQIGETWGVPLAALSPVLLPGGPIHRDRAIWDAWDLFDLEQAFSSGSLHWHLNDELDCRLEEVFWSDGRQVARVSLAWRWWGWVDLVSALEDHQWQRLLELDNVIVELAMHGQGELLWDIDAGHFRGFELEAELGVELHLSRGSGSIEVRASGQGSWTSTAT